MKQVIGILIALAAVFPARLCAQETPAVIDVPVQLDPAGWQVSADAVIDRDDRLMVVWKDSLAAGQRILAQAFDRLGGRIGGIFSVSGQLSGYRGRPALAVNYGGTAAIAWTDSVSDTTCVLYRRYKMTGDQVDKFPLPPDSVSLLVGRNPAVALDSLGNVLMVWQNMSEQGYDILGAHFAFSDSLGHANTDSLLFAWKGKATVNELRQGDQVEPDIAADRAGSFLVAWRQLGDSSSVRARLYGRDGKPLNQESRISDSLAARVSSPRVAWSRDSGTRSRFLVCWVEEKDTTSAVVLLQYVLEYFSGGSTSFSAVGPVEVHSDSALSFESLSLAADEGGTVTVAWQETSGAQSACYAKQFRASQGPSDPVITLAREAQGAAGRVFAPAVAVRPGGGFVAVWEDRSGTDTDLRMQKFDAVGNLDPLHISLKGGPDEFGRSAALVTHPDSSFTLVWEQESSGKGQIDSVSFNFSGQMMGPGDKLAANDWDQRKPAAAGDTTGKYIIAWQESGTDGYRIQAALFDSSRTLIDSVRTVAFSDRSDQDSLASLANVAVDMGAGGHCTLVWEKWSSLATAPDLMLARYDSLGARQGQSVIVAEASFGGGRMAAVSMGRHGHHMVVWRQGTVDRQNAYVRARVYGPAGQPVSLDLRVSADTIQYLGSGGRPVVASSPLNGNFLVAWQEFFSDRQRLYYSLYDSLGNNLPINGSLRGSFETEGETDLNRTSPSLAVDENGDYLILWAEKKPAGPVSLVGRKIGADGDTVGHTFTLPGVTMGALPKISVPKGKRIMVAWQDTLGGQVRILAQTLDFFNVSGWVVLAGSAPGNPPVIVHIEGNVRDSVAADPQGRFVFRTLIQGEYRLWVTSAGRLLTSRRDGFVLKSGGPSNLDLGLVATLEPDNVSLPRGRSFSLFQNVPNPFNPSTSITFILSGQDPEIVSLSVFNLRGALVRTLINQERLTEGAYSASWDGEDDSGRKVASGVYLCRLRVGSKSAFRKMVLLK